jgi:hypothetical protein
MATLTVQEVDRDGMNITFSAATSTTGDDFVAADDQRHAVLVRNNGETDTVTVTMSKQTLSAQQVGSGVLSVSDIQQSLAPGAQCIMPVLPNFIRTNDGKVQVTCNTVVQVGIAAIKLPKLAY